MCYFRSVNSEITSCYHGLNVLGKLDSIHASTPNQTLCSKIIPENDDPDSNKCAVCL